MSGVDCSKLDGSWSEKTRRTEDNLPQQHHVVDWGLGLGQPLQKTSDRQAWTVIVHGETNSRIEVG